jgi:SAM-dependent methyltransferase
MITNASLPESPSFWTQFTERVLTRFSKYIELPFGGQSEGEPLKVLQREYPDLEPLVSGKKVLDFGCGQGFQSALLTTVYGCSVTGIDTNAQTLAFAQREHAKLPIRFIDKLDGERYDVVISQNSMEHFPDPAAILADMRRVITPSGLILMTFGPPWYAPYGSHMHFFCKIPWLQLWCPESVVMKVRAKYVQDGAKRYPECTGGLNKMSLRKFERLLRHSGLNVVRKRYTGVKGFNFLTRIPVLRELFTVHATVILTRKYRNPGGGAAIVPGISAQRK